MKYYTPILGCDPEFFFKKDGKTLEAEKVLPKEGLQTSEYMGKVIIDGVQAELNPGAQTCREMLASNIVGCFYNLSQHMETGVSTDFSQVIGLSDEELEAMSDNSKKFGCSPSKNLDGKLAGKITVDPAKYKFRSAGGHIHLGFEVGGQSQLILKSVMDKPEKLVPVLDIVLGNTCVLLDKNPLNKERRKVYGRAGEFRTPKHGIEYRTLSNFWLQSYPLMSLVFALARISVNIVANNLEDEFFKLIDMKKVVEAINNNKFSLALRNFKKIEKLLAKTSDELNHDGINSDNLAAFHHFISKDMSYWFPEDPLKHWLSKDSDMGWENFAEFVIKADMNGKPPIRNASVKTQPSVAVYSTTQGTIN